MADLDNIKKITLPMELSGPIEENGVLKDKDSQQFYDGIISASKMLDTEIVRSIEVSSYNETRKTLDSCQCSDFEFSMYFLSDFAHKLNDEIRSQIKAGVLSPKISVWPNGTTYIEDVYDLNVIQGKTSTYGDVSMRRTDYW